MDIKELNTQIKSCNKCALCESRTNVVVGRGTTTPDIIFIGEAPGEEEDLQGKPFVGRSGMLLDRAISENGIKNYCILNILKCRPEENRKPTKEELKACSPWLEQQLALLNPKLVVCLGSISLSHFFPEKTITKTVTEGQALVKDGRRYVALFHPSYALRGAIPVSDYIKSFGRINFFLADGQLDQGREAGVGDPQPNPLNPPIPPCPAPRKPMPGPGQSLDVSGQATDSVLHTTDSALQAEISTPHISAPEMGQKYVPLHLHTEHGSIQDVFRTDTELAEDLSQKGFSACAITDHGSLSGLIYAQAALKAKGIKCIHGIEAYVNEGEREQSHIVLLVKNEIGYKNLLKLHTISKSPDHHHKVFNKVFQKISINEICKHSEGLICSTACISGALARRWKRNEPEKVDEMMKKLKTAFGEDLYLEVMPNRLEEQARFNEYLLGIADIYNIKLILTTDSHYNSPSDKKYHDIVKAVAYKKTLTNKTGEKGWRQPGFSDDTFCNLTTSEVAELLRTNHPKLYPIRDELFANTLEVASKCNFELPENLGDTLIGDEQEARQNILDRMDIPGYKEASGHDPKEIDERIEKELKLIFDRGFAKYFNSVLDMCDYADKNDVPRGPGRGSVGGSLVAYLLGITKVDPLRFGTLWERFLSPTRTPDIDMDFSGDKRGLVIGHLRAKYGFGNIAYVITFSEFQDRAVLKDVGRVYEVSLEEISRVTKELATKTAENIKIEDALLTSEVVQAFNKKHPEVIEAALRLRGKIRHIGMHAAGVIICDGLQEKIPTELYDRADSRNSIVTSWEKDALEKIGLVKFDVLGISVLDIMDECIKSAGISWDDLPEDYNDPQVFKLLKSGKTSGIFQFGSQLVTDYLRHLDPNTFDDLVATNALCRPGPLNSGMAMDYVARKGGKPWDYDHAKLEPIVKDTYGIICYQEQIMQTANQIGGFSMVESEKFMKAVAKSKGRDALKEKEEEFYNGAISNGLTKQCVEDLFNKILEFGRYSFNRSHSVEYSMLGYWTAWLKLYYPLSFYCSLINNEADEVQTLKYIKEAQDFNIIIKPPSVEYPSERSTFDADTDTIYLGLNKVKGIGPEEVKKIIEAGSRFDEIKKVRKNIFEILVSIGYLDSIEPNRRRLLEGKELSGNTLWRFAENKRDDSDWSEEERMTRLRKYLSWPRSADELPDTKYQEYKRNLNSLKEDEVENKAFLSVGWVFDSKTYNNSSGTTYTLSYEDGTARVVLNLSNVVYQRHKNIVDRVIKGELKEPLQFCLHPYYFNRGRVEPREGKLNIEWIGEMDMNVPENILDGMKGETESLGNKQFLITNISYGTSKAGNKYASVEAVDNAENVTYGVMMDKGNFGLPSYGSVIRGRWNDTGRGCFWRSE